MACDISKIFLSIVRALNSSEFSVDPPQKSSSLPHAKSEKSGILLKPDVFGARARGLFIELRIVHQHITKASSLSIVLASHDVVRQKLYHELSKKIVDALDQCTKLLGQLRQYSQMTTTSVVSDTQQLSQLEQHQIVVCRLLEETLNSLKRQRDDQVEKYCRRLNLTASLSSGNSSTSHVFTRPSETQSNVVRRRQHSWLSSGPFVSAAEAVSSKDLTNDELQMLETENAEIYLQFLSDQSEVRDLGTSISEIGRLQSLISDSLAEQAEKAERIGDQIIGSTEDVKNGNAKLREAMDRTMSVRLWIVFIMLVLTFSLHFLDWYR